MPGDKESPNADEYDEDEECCFEYDRGKYHGYNQRGIEDKAWLTARLTTLEDAFDNCSCASVTHLGDCALKAKIREHFTGEGR